MGAQTRHVGSQLPLNLTPAASCPISAQELLMKFAHFNYISVHFHNFHVNEVVTIDISNKFITIKHRLPLMPTGKLMNSPKVQAIFFIMNNTESRIKPPYSVIKHLHYHKYKCCQQHHYARKNSSEFKRTQRLTSNSCIWKKIHILHQRCMSCTDN